MLQLVLYGLLAIIVAAGLFLLASRFLPAGEQIALPLRDEVPWELPAQRMLHPDEVDDVRLPVALRGYRFAETDILLDRLAAELRIRDQEITRLRGLDTSGDGRTGDAREQQSSVDAGLFRRPDFEATDGVVAGSHEGDDGTHRGDDDTHDWAPPAVTHTVSEPQAPPSDDDEVPVEQPATPPVAEPIHSPAEDADDGR